MFSLAVSLISFFIFISPSVLFAGEVVIRDAHYELYANGIVKDTWTGLEWYVGPDKGTSWKEAKSWVDSLNVGGGCWRMPTLEELESIYQRGAGSRNMTVLLETSGWDVWSGNTWNVSHGCFFYFTGHVAWLKHGYSYCTRSFAVRFR